MNRKEAPVIAFFPEASFGAALNCVGIAQELRAMGAHPVFLTHGGFGGVFADYGFDEFAVPVQSELTEEETQTYWQEFLSHHLPHFNMHPTDQLTTYVEPVWNAIVETAESVEQGLETTLERTNPDVVVLDNVIMFPAIVRSERPWVRVISCAETELPDNCLPPYLSGLPASDAAGCAAFRDQYLETLGPIHARYNKFRLDKGLELLPEGEFLETSPHQNLLLAPSIIRHDRDQVLDSGQFTFLEGCVRQEGPYRVPQMPRNDGPLVYVSFGSLGAMDVPFFESLFDVFKTMDMRFLVNVGAQIDAYSRVPDNVHLQEWFPQPSVVEQCDLFIHHGGNNSFCEALYFGVPSLILPYCWDGHDNAQRAVETSVGLRVNRWDWTPEQLDNSINQLLGDAEMKARLAANSEIMQLRKSVQLAAQKILDCVNPNRI